MLKLCWGNYANRNKSKEGKNHIVSFTCGMQRKAKSINTKTTATTTKQILSCSQQNGGYQKGIKEKK